MVCPVHGGVDRQYIAKGYEYGKDLYLVVEDTDVEAILPERSKAIEIEQFIEQSELDPTCLNTFYYVVPEGKVAEEGFRTLRDAMRQTKRIGSGRMVMAGKENVVTLAVQGKGLRPSSIYYPNEVRDPAPYFADIHQGDVDPKLVEMARLMVENNTREFDPSQFKDRYQDALHEIIRGRWKGKRLLWPGAEPGKVADIMEALRRSLGQTKHPQRLAESLLLRALKLLSNLRGRSVPEIT